MKNFRKAVAFLMSLILVFSVFALAMTANAETSSNPTTKVTSYNGDDYFYQKTISQYDAVENEDGTSTYYFKVDIDAGNKKVVTETPKVGYHDMDIVLVFDTSITMAPYVDAERKNARQFLNELYKSGSNINVSIVEFGSAVSPYYSTLLDWTSLTSSSMITSSGGKVYEALEDLPKRYVLGTTRLDVALEQTDKLLSDKASDGRDKFVMVFSDGETCGIAYSFMNTYRNNTVNEAYKIKNKTYGSSSGEKAKIFSVWMQGTTAAINDDNWNTMVQISNSSGINYSSFQTSDWGYTSDSDGNPTWMIDYSETGWTNSAYNKILKSIKYTSYVDVSNTSHFTKDTVISDILNSNFHVYGPINVECRSTLGYPAVNNSVAGTTSTSSVSVYYNWDDNGYAGATVKSFDFENNPDTTRIDKNGKRTHTYGDYLHIDYIAAITVKETTSCPLNIVNNDITAEEWRNWESGSLIIEDDTVHILGTENVVLSVPDTSDPLSDPVPITFYGNGSTEGTMPQQTGEFGGTITLNKNQFKKQSEIFYFDANGGETTSTDDDGTTYVPEDNYLDVNGDPIESDLAEVDWNTSDVLYISKYYQFDGWGTAADLEWVDYEDNATISLGTHLLNLYAQWIAPSVTLPSKGFSKEGYKLIGWSTDKNATTPEYLPGEKISCTSIVDVDNVTLYAVYAPAYTYTVHFDMNKQTTSTGDNGTYTGSMEDQIIIKDVDTTLTENAFTKTQTISYVFQEGEYYKNTTEYKATLQNTKAASFIGWNTKPDGSGTSYTNGQAITELMKDGDTVVANGGEITLYAQWENRIRSGFASKEGYDFEGWATKADATVDDVEYGNELITMTENNLILYPVFTSDTELPETGAVTLVILIAVSAAAILAYFVISRKNKSQSE